MNESMPTSLELDDVCDEILRIFKQTQPPPSTDEIEHWHQNRKRVHQTSAIRLAELPERIAQDLSHPDYDPAKGPRRALEAALSEGRRMVLMLGKPGTGKTLAACNEVLRLPGAFYVRADHYAELASQFETKRDARVIQGKTSLVIDDIGTEPERQGHLIEALVSMRYDDSIHCTTILTSNLTRQEFWDRYGIRVSQRIGDYRHSRMVHCTEELRPRSRPRAR